MLDKEVSISFSSLEGLSSGSLDDEPLSDKILIKKKGEYRKLWNIQKGKTRKYRNK